MLNHMSKGLQVCQFLQEKIAALFGQVVIWVEMFEYLYS